MPEETEETAVDEGGRPTRAQRNQLRPYDFRRPSQISRDDLRQLVAYCEQFGRRASVTLSSDLSALATVAPPEVVTQCTYEELVTELESPAHVLVLSVRPASGSALLYIPARVALTLVERKMGGPGSPEQKLRSLTEIEVGVLAEMIAALLEDFGASIAPLVRVNVAVSRVESNPQLVQAVPAPDVVTVLRFGVRIGDLSDEIEFCLPASFWQEAFKTRPTSETKVVTESQQRARRVLRNRVLDTPSKVRLRFDPVPVSVSDIANLAPGDEIPLGTLAGDPLTVDVSGTPTFSAAWVADGRRDAFQVLEVHRGTGEARSIPELEDEAAPAAGPGGAFPAGTTNNPMEGN